MKSVVIVLILSAAFMCNGCGDRKNDTTQEVSIDTTKTLLLGPDLSDRELPNDIDALKAIIEEQDEEIRQLENKLDECESNNQIEPDYDITDGIRGRL